jgi:hypothetical protein
MRILSINLTRGQADIPLAFAVKKYGHKLVFPVLHTASDLNRDRNTLFGREDDDFYFISVSIWTRLLITYIREASTFLGLPCREAG